jgi:hypothetical protein
MTVLKSAGILFSDAQRQDGYPLGRGSIESVNSVEGVKYGEFVREMAQGKDG